MRPCLLRLQIIIVARQHLALSLEINGGRNSIKVATKCGSRGGQLGKGRESANEQEREIKFH